MLFNSYIFVLFFLPATILGYFLLNKLPDFRPSHVFLLCMSLWFYAYFNLSYLPIILVSIFFNFGIYLGLSKDFKLTIRRLLLFSALLFNIGILFYFKYFDFFTENVNALFHTDFTLRHLVLPLGISFFTFQQLSFVIDSYKREVPRYGFLQYALFVTYFPQLIAGPIVTHDELVPQFQDQSKRRFDWGNFSQGLYLFAFGMAKKVLLADTFGNAANWGFSNIPSLDSISAFITMLSYTIQIYFDFSGYCDMAIGIGKMMNIDLPLNFDSPYKSLTITEFWDRWHMTLTRFFTRYVYIPLGGSRKGKYRTYLNMMVVFLVSGLWHGANWTFILWGALHGAFAVITRHWHGFFEKLHPALNWLLTFSFVNMAWVLFRADSIADAAQLLHRIGQLSFTGLRQELVNCFNLEELSYAWLHILRFDILNRYGYFFFVLFFLLAIGLILGSKNAYEKMNQFSPSWAKSLSTAVLLVWCIFSFAGISTFLYFNF